MSLGHARELCAKTAEPIEMPIGYHACGPHNHMALEGGLDSRGKRIFLGRHVPALCKVCTPLSHSAHTPKIKKTNMDWVFTWKVGVLAASHKKTGEGGRVEKSLIL